MPKTQTDGSSATNGQAGTSDGQNNDSNPQTVVPDDIYSYYEKIDQDDEEETELKTVSFQINQTSLETLQKRCCCFCIPYMIVTFYNKSFKLILTVANIFIFCTGV